MWMFGKCTKEELAQLKEWGWEIDRLISKEEINKLCDPSYDKDKDPNFKEYDDEVCPLIWVDQDIFEELKGVHDQEEAHRDMLGREVLENRRREFADDALGTYDFHNCEQSIGEDEEINDTGNWESDGPDHLICPVYYGDKSKDDPDEEGSYKGSFIVEFAPNSAEIIDKHESMG